MEVGYDDLQFFCWTGSIAQGSLEKAQAEFLDYAQSGMSVMELSHRSKEFDDIIKEAESLLRELMDIPDNYRVLFLQVGPLLSLA